MAPSNAVFALVGALSLGCCASALQIPLGPLQIEVPVAAPKLLKLPWLGAGHGHGHGNGNGHGHDDKPLVHTDVLQDSIKIETLQRRAKTLYDIAKLSQKEFEHPTRTVGSKGHRATLKYIRSVLADLGDYYTVSDQHFHAENGIVFEDRLVVGNDVPKSSRPLYLTPPTRNNEPVFADFSLVDDYGCKESDYPEGISGRIAFIQRGECSFNTKSALAAKAGAVAAVVYNNADESFNGSLESGSETHVPTWAMSGEEGRPVAERLRRGEAIDGIAYMHAMVESVQTTNIVAQTVGGDPDNCVMLGGHSDSVPEGPGINDDGSGSLSVLEVAVQLANFRVNNCVRFAWWSAEELGLVGSNYYVDNLPAHENQKVRVFLDYDMMASPNFAYQVYNATNAENPAGSEELRNLYVDWYEAQGLNYTFIPFDGRSDYDGFIRAGIPAGGIATGAEEVKTPEEAAMFGGKAGEWFDPCYHQLCDDLSNINSTAWEVNTKLIAHSVATYAHSFKGFPERSADFKSASYGREFRRRGSRFIV